MPYFVKYTLDGRIWSWCYAAGVSRSGGQVVVSGPVVPLGDGPPRTLCGGRLAWDEKTGRINAYAISARPWLAGPAELKLPRSIPAEIRRQGLSAAVEHVLRGSYLARFFTRDDIRRLVGAERLLESAEGLLRRPQFVPEGDSGLQAWASERPAAAQFAAEDAARAVQASGLGGELAVARGRLRREAHRKLDAAQEGFTGSPALGGEPFIEFTTPAGVVRVGAVLKAVYDRGAGAPAVGPLVKDEAVLLAMEGAILPGSGSLEEKLALLPWQRRFAQWEAANPRPAIGYLHWGGASAPPGFLRRPGLEGGAADYASLGLPIMISQAATDYLAAKAYEAPPPFECALWCLGRAWAA
jgi:hypothetical protein